MANLSRLARGATLSAAILFAATPGTGQQASGPIVRYTMDAGTISGMAAMGGGLGGMDDQN